MKMANVLKPQGRFWQLTQFNKLNKHRVSLQSSLPRSKVPRY
ncbi:hypothetical protein HanIR_Chr12g0584681 [Helianthus annuus]|nr:hypothetical protein HanIR_Chr12g0584681 [Helianthus annuus]